MNLAGRWFAELTNRELRRSAHRSVTELETDIRKWTSEWNKNPRPFVWTKTADDILETLAAYRRVSSQERQAGRRESPPERSTAAARRPRSRAAAGPARTSARHGPARGSLPRPPHGPARHGPGPGRSPGPGTREPRRLPTTGQPGPRAYNHAAASPESRSSTPRNSPAPAGRAKARSTSASDGGGYPPGGTAGSLIAGDVFPGADRPRGDDPRAAATPGQGPSKGVSAQMSIVRSTLASRSSSAWLAPSGEYPETHLPEGLPATSLEAPPARPARSKPTPPQSSPRARPALRRRRPGQSDVEFQPPQVHVNRIRREPARDPSRGRLQHLIR